MPKLTVYCYYDTLQRRYRVSDASKVYLDKFPRESLELRLSVYTGYANLLRRALKLSLMLFIITTAIIFPIVIFIFLCFFGKFGLITLFGYPVACVWYLGITQAHLLTYKSEFHKMMFIHSQDDTRRMNMMVNWRISKKPFTLNRALQPMPAPIEIFIDEGIDEHQYAPVLQHNLYPNVAQSPRIKRDDKYDRTSALTDHTAETELTVISEADAMVDYYVPPPPAYRKPETPEMMQRTLSRSRRTGPVQDRGYNPFSEPSAKSQVTKSSYIHHTPAARSPRVQSLMRSTKVHSLPSSPLANRSSVESSGTLDAFLPGIATAKTSPTSSNDTDVEDRRSIGVANVEKSNSDLPISKMRPRSPSMTETKNATQSSATKDDLKRRFKDWGVIWPGTSSDRM